jgi:hypothetical protein
MDGTTKGVFVLVVAQLQDMAALALELRGTAPAMNH